MPENGASPLPLNHHAVHHHRDPFHVTRDFFCPPPFVAVLSGSRQDRDLTSHHHLYSPLMDSRMFFQARADGGHQLLVACAGSMGMALHGFGHSGHFAPALSSASMKTSDCRCSCGPVPSCRTPSIVRLDLRRSSALCCVLALPCRSSNYGLLKIRGRDEKKQSGSRSSRLFNACDRAFPWRRELGFSCARLFQVSLVRAGRSAVPPGHRRTIAHQRFASANQNLVMQHNDNGVYRFHGAPTPDFYANRFSLRGSRLQPSSSRRDQVENIQSGT